MAHSEGGVFPISRDPPEGGTINRSRWLDLYEGLFPISRDPPEGGTSLISPRGTISTKGVSNF